MSLKIGHRVRIDIPDELDLDFELYGEYAIVLDNDSGWCTFRRIVLEPCSERY